MSLYSEVRERLELHKIILATSPWVSEGTLENYRLLKQELNELAPNVQRVQKILTDTRPASSSTAQKSENSKKKRPSPKKKIKKSG